MKSINLEKLAGATFAAQTLESAIDLRATSQHAIEAANTVLQNLYHSAQSHPNKNYADGILEVLNNLAEIKVGA